jgi:hypothetical protein
MIRKALLVMGCLAGVHGLNADTIVDSFPGSIQVALATCVPTTFMGGCADARPGTFGVWRIVNWLPLSGWMPDPNGPGDLHLRDVTFRVENSAGLTTWAWDEVENFVETEPFDLSFMPGLISFHLEVTLPSKVHIANDYQRFIADIATVAGTGTRFPPPLDLYVPGTFIFAVPEPASAVLLGIGLLSLLSARVLRRN